MYQTFIESPSAYFLSELTCQKIRRFFRLAKERLGIYRLLLALAFQKNRVCFMHPVINRSGKGQPQIKIHCVAAFKFSEVFVPFVLITAGIIFLQDSTWVNGLG